uniref:Uncharacterized protein n=1 Tax=Periophthalmus magnuspinnatus TaxID=409849 RepID=A0A3B4B5Y5_9GOBI
MAEIGKGVTAGKLAINVQKRLTRAQEKVLQKLGKADETRDAVFEEMVSNFNKQMVRTFHPCTCDKECYMRTFHPCTYDKECYMRTFHSYTLWLDFHQNLTDKSVLVVDTYLAQFPEIKARIAKRDRKMVDFDSARHHFANLQKGKKKDEAKIAKPTALLEMAAPSWAQGLISAHQVAQTNLSYNQAEEELGRAQKIFEELNVELQDELPVLWDSRVGVYVNTFQTMAKNQEKFHREMSKVRLAEDLKSTMKQKQTNKWRTAPERPLSLDPPSQQNSKDPVEKEKPGGEPQATQLRARATQLRARATQLRARATQLRARATQLRARATQLRARATQLRARATQLRARATQLRARATQLRVKAVHDYAATDGDELELKVGDMVLVLAFDNPDEQDDGWLLGLKESHWVQKKDLSGKGVFPENFTTKV